MKKNRDFFYLQYNKISWKNQEKTKINFLINNYIIENVILKHQGRSISIFDIGFGIGFFIKMLYEALGNRYDSVSIDGCEPSKVNFRYWQKTQPKRLKPGTTIDAKEVTFLAVRTTKKFDFIIATYVFPHFLFGELEQAVKKIYQMLNQGGRFVLVLADEKYLKTKLASEKDLFIESGEVIFRGKRYKEVLHYSDIPKIGKVIDYNREEAFYKDLFKTHRFVLKKQTEINDNGFICNLFVFERR